MVFSTRPTSLTHCLIDVQQNAQDSEKFLRPETRRLHVHAMLAMRWWRPTGKSKVRGIVQRLKKGVQSSAVVGADVSHLEKEASYC